VTRSHRQTSPYTCAGPGARPFGSAPRFSRALAWCSASGLGNVADALDLETEVPFEELPGWPGATAPWPPRKASLRSPVRRACGRPSRGRFSPLRGSFRRARGATGPADGQARRPDGGPDERCRRGQSGVRRRHTHGHRRPPESDRPVAHCPGRTRRRSARVFPDMTEVWDADLRSRVHAAADAEGVALAEGVYACLLGPSYETPAEVQMLARLGADAVGMSTVLEAVAARWAASGFCGVSLVTNPGAGSLGRRSTAMPRCWQPPLLQGRGWPASSSASSGISARAEWHPGKSCMWRPPRLARYIVAGSASIPRAVDRMRQK